MTFGDALEQMKAGARMARRMWIFSDTVYVKYTSADLQPYLVIQSGEHEAMPYTATDIDLFADDWEVAR